MLEYTTMPEFAYYADYYASIIRQRLVCVCVCVCVCAFSFIPTTYSH